MTATVYVCTECHEPNYEDGNGWAEEELSCDDCGEETMHYKDELETP